MGKDINKLIEETLESFDKIQRAEPPPFFETRLKARMEKELLGKRMSNSFIAKPVWVLTVLATLFILNITVLNNTKYLVEELAETSVTSVQGFAQEYNLDTNTGY